MAVVKTYLQDASILEFIGLSTDDKPADVPGGSQFKETDTGKTYFYNGSSWARAYERRQAMPYGYDIAEGNVPGHTAINWVGVCITAGTNEETIWDQAGVYAYIASAMKLNVSSSSTNDGVNGTGARTVDLSGLDANYAPISETVSLNKQAAVETEETYLRIFSIIVASAGSGGKNVGDIYAGTGGPSSGVPTTKYCKALVGHNKSLSGFWTVPADNTLFMTQIFLSESANKVTDFHLYSRVLNGIFTLDYHLELNQTTASLSYNVPLVFAAKTDVEGRVVSASSGAHCTLSFGGWYET